MCTTQHKSVLLPCVDNQSFLQGSFPSEKNDNYSLWEDKHYVNAKYEKLKTYCKILLTLFTCIYYTY